MINIIKKGNLFPYQITCPNCECIFEFQDEDIKMVQSKPNEWFWRIYCPTCNQEINSWSKYDWRKDNINYD